VVLIKGKRVAGFEPAILAVSAFIARAKLDHKMKLEIRSKNVEVKSMPHLSAPTFKLTPAWHCKMLPYHVVTMPATSNQIPEDVTPA
jgi:hypothetical protein